MEKKLKYRMLEKYKSEGMDTVLSIDVGKIYHVVEGRNAWHSTWITQYMPRSFYSSLMAAKEYAETIRKSGSSLTIKENPCLVIRSEKRQCLS